ncbi:MAG: hypothetical protein PHW04_16140 [Candidatus Wallbacteria bacterium]|nr:hypothetical protein [Candidatus Wallbacteria bacterium]
MQKVVLNILDDSKAKILIKMLESLDFIKITSDKKTAREFADFDSIKEICGIWKDRDINIHDLRKKAWKRDLV